MIGKTNAISAGGTDTSDATAVVSDILLGKTAYLADGEKHTGTIPTWDGTFEGNATAAVNLKSLFDITHISRGMFSDNTSITDLSEFFDEKTTENVTDFFGMYSGCTNLTRVDLNLSSAINISKMLYNCSNIRTFNFYGDTYPITEISQSFYGCIYLTSFNFSKCTVLKKIGNYSFLNSGITSVDLSSTIIEEIGESAFASCSSLRSVNFNDKIKNIKNYAFQSNTNCDYWFKTKIPPTLDGSNVWSGASNYALLVPYTNINDYKIATNWTALTSYITGYAKDGDLDSLPVFDDTGYRLTWYSDKACTNQITTFQSGDLYCKSASTKEGIFVNTIALNCTLTLLDSNDNVLTGSMFEPNTVIKIHVESDEGYSQKYILTVNDLDISNDDTVTLTEDITITAIWYDGTNIPVNPTFSANSWGAIKIACQNGLASQLWNLGDTKTVTLTNGETYTVRIADMTANRYQYSDGTSGGTHCVFEFVELQTTSYYMNSTNINAGGWNSSYMRNTVVNGTFYNLLPNDLKETLKLVSTYAMNGGNNATGLAESQDYLFLPTEYEIFGTSSYASSTEATSQFQLYANNNTSSFRIKHKLDNTNSIWWLRSAGSSYNNRFCIVNEYGNNNRGYAYYEGGVALFFAL